KDGEWGLFIHGVDGLACTIAGLKLSAAQPFPTGTWTHVGCVYDGQELRVYIDGQMVANTPNNSSIADNNTTLLFGCNSPGCDERMVGGRLDAVRIWTAARTGAEICADADACP
ncbi:MAG TPA: LamG domain-containing protein, partial [Nannocystis sp.]